MRIKRVALVGGGACAAVWNGSWWVPLSPAMAELPALCGGLAPRDVRDALSLASAGPRAHEAVRSLLASPALAALEGTLRATVDGTVTLLPFTPASLRDASLSYAHNVNAALGFIAAGFGGLVGRLALLVWWLLVGWWSGATFPPVKPSPLWWQRPLFYTGNHMTCLADGDTLLAPRAALGHLDYELEVALVVGREGRNMSAGAARTAIAGYVLINDWSARSIQLQEMRSGFGLPKSKGFGTTIGSVLVTPDEIDDIGALRGIVRVNGVQRGRGVVAPINFSPQELLAFCSEGEDVFPGELLGLGTVAGCSGIEVQASPLKPGDVVELEMEPFGIVGNVVAEDRASGDGRWRNNDSVLCESVLPRARIEHKFRL